MFYSIFKCISHLLRVGTDTHALLDSAKSTFEPQNNDDSNGYENGFGSTEVCMFDVKTFIKLFLEKKNFQFQ